MAVGRFIKGGGDDFAIHRTQHFGDLFRALVNEQYNKVAVGIVMGDRVGYVFAVTSSCPLWVAKR